MFHRTEENNSSIQVKITKEQVKTLVAVTSSAQLILGLLMLTQAETKKMGLLGAFFAGSGLGGATYSFSTDAKDINLRDYLKEYLGGGLLNVTNGMINAACSNIKYLNPMVIGSVGNIIATLVSSKVKFAISGDEKDKDSLFEAGLYGALRGGASSHAKKFVKAGAENGVKNMLISTVTGVISGITVGSICQATMNFFAKDEKKKGNLVSASAKEAANSTAVSVIHAYRQSYK